MITRTALGHTGRMLIAGRIETAAYALVLIAALGLTQSFPQAVCYLNEYGFWLFVAKGATPIPLKQLTITAGFIAMPLLVFNSSPTHGGKKAI